MTRGGQIVSTAEVPHRSEFTHWSVKAPSLERHNCCFKGFCWNCTYIFPFLHRRIGVYSKVKKNRMWNGLDLLCCSSCETKSWKSRNMEEKSKIIHLWPLNMSTTIQYHLAYVIFNLYNTKEVMKFVSSPVPSSHFLVLSCSLETFHLCITCSV